MKSIFSKFLFLGLFSIAVSFAEENEEWDRYYKETIEPVEWMGHLWYPYCLEHSRKCPCMNERE